MGMGEEERAPFTAEASKLSDAYKAAKGVVKTDPEDSDEGKDKPAKKEKIQIKEVGGKADKKQSKKEKKAAEEAAKAALLAKEAAEEDDDTDDDSDTDSENDE